MSFEIFVLVAQLSAAHLRHATVVEPSAMETADAGLRRGREPSAVAAAVVPDEDVVTVTPPRPPVPERAPLALYLSLIGAGLLLLSYVASAIRGATARERGENVHTKIALPEGDVEHYSAVIKPPSTAQEYVAYIDEDVKLSRVLPEGTPPRTAEECHELYLQSVESLVRQMVWPLVLHYERELTAPVEMQWRAWLGDEGWDRAHLLRATGKELGQALKVLLKKYKENGGAWISHAVAGR